MQRSPIRLRRVPCEDHGQSASSQVQRRRSGEGQARAQGEVPRRSEGQQRSAGLCAGILRRVRRLVRRRLLQPRKAARSEEHTSELQSHVNLVCRLLLEKKKKKSYTLHHYKKKTKKYNTK